MQVCANVHVQCDVYTCSPYVYYGTANLSAVKPNFSPFGSSMTRVSAVPTSRIVYLQPRFHVHDLNHEYFMYIRVFMNMIWITNTLCRTVFSCTWPELRIVYVQPRFHVHDLNHVELFMYINCAKKVSVHNLCTIVFSGTYATQICS